VPIRTYAEWDERRPGFLETDLVGHDGGRAEGEFLWSLNATDVASTWSETVAVRNRAQVWTFEALQKIKDRLPFKLLGIDSDNDGAFINAHLIKYCHDNQLTFTRSRPAKKMTVVTLSRRTTQWSDVWLAMPAMIPRRNKTS